MPEYALALGTFDGLHLGHKAVLENIIKKGLTPIALTFNTPPKSGENPNLIMSSNEKIERLKALGIRSEIMDFEKVKDTSPEDFLSFIQKEYSPKIITTGYNFRFGKGAAGDTEMLGKFCKANGIKYVCTNAVLKDGKPVSSTRIRELISDGNVKKAGEMLGGFFSFSGVVGHGDERGRTIGFPTVNVPYPNSLVTPRFGVYASITEYRGALLKSVTDIGIRPTFETDYVISETNIINFNNDIYGKKVRIYLVDFIRDETKFAGINDLQRAIAVDKEIAVALLDNINF